MIFLIIACINSSGEGTFVVENGRGFKVGEHKSHPFCTKS